MESQAVNYKVWCSENEDDSDASVKEQPGRESARLRVGQGAAVSSLWASL